jgi:hypothetical protein
LGGELGHAEADTRKTGIGMQSGRGLCGVSQP